MLNCKTPRLHLPLRETLHSGEDPQQMIFAHPKNYNSPYYLQVWSLWPNFQRGLSLTAPVAVTILWGFSPCKFLTLIVLLLTQGKNTTSAYESCRLGSWGLRFSWQRWASQFGQPPTNRRQAEHQRATYNYISDTLHLAMPSLLKSEPVFTLII